MSTLAIALLAACSANVVGAESESSEQEMAVGESIAMDAGRLDVTFEGVPFDNRCPRDVQCIVAGMAKAAITVKIEGEEEHPLTLEFGPRGPQAVEVGGYSLSLTAVEPYPVSSKRIEPQDYRVQLHWELVD